MKKNMEFWDKKSAVSISGINKYYLESFKDHQYPNKDKKSMLAYNNYKSAIQRFNNYIDNKDILTITPNDIKKYAEQHTNPTTAKNQRNFIRGVIIFLVKNNVMKAKSKVNKDLLIELI